jgi:hypothetical protein
MRDDAQKGDFDERGKGHGTPFIQLLLQPAGRPR